ncbi:beta-1,3-galactosyl-O-glycosyl-glycoprotein beta-1,6-N-acetylglucosaminyltransferase-like [Gigantopelta aegis]|uniref:beta-1,3-galactosyl-O-glycosyl-glycoprotein beta-1,6-N-acetylglucosaminyltransferase-like n=1 Tax=Gigantopelta aegis TaxID=1735272 RepID=UPI001B88CF06|nr:beta-1,3-galactosyl-O-glycosyl-glycoprotein beta-1,6-N-acetylglucosaminyltransferase-like [Gigantopelta aegis]
MIVDLGVPKTHPVKIDHDVSSMKSREIQSHYIPEIVRDIFIIVETFSDQKYLHLMGAMNGLPMKPYITTKLWMRRCFLVLCLLGLYLYYAKIIERHFSGKRLVGNTTSYRLVVNTTPYRLVENTTPYRLVENTTSYRLVKNTTSYRLVKNTPYRLVHKTSAAINLDSRELKIANISNNSRGGKYVIPHREVVKISCSQLIAGIKSARHKTKQLMRSIQTPFLRNSYFVNATRNCHAFRSKRGYILNSMTSEEEHFPIAIGIMLHRDVNQFERLLRAIYRPQNIYCIHVDKKADLGIRRAVEGIASCFDNVFLTSRSVNVVWSQFGMLEADLICMKELLQREKWKYYLNLAAQEFPLKTNYDLVKILEALNGANDVDVDNTGVFRGRWRAAGLPPHRLQCYKGMRYLAVCRDFVRYVLHDPVARDFLEWCRKTYMPEETFFATLNHNQILSVPGGYKGSKSPRSNENDKPYLARFVNWGTLPCAGKTVRAVCVFGIGDLPLLVNRKELFANKFHFDFQPYALDCVEEWHYNRTRDEYSGILRFDDSYYRQLDLRGIKTKRPIGKN